MATQKFLQGGYVGKLGATVGQRWKNIRTVRAYAIPHNPRTELQQSNRQRFAQAIKLAQISMILNKGATYWQSDSKTEFQLRTSQAKKDVDRGVTGYSAVPIIPSGTVPYLTLTDVGFMRRGAGLMLVSNGILEYPDPRNFIFGITLEKEGTSDYDLFFFEGQYDTTDDALGIIEEPEGYVFDDESIIFGVTTDDNQNSGNTIYIPPHDLGAVFITQLSDVQHTLEGNTLTFTSATFASKTPSVQYSFIWSWEGTDTATGSIVTRKFTYNATSGQGSSTIGVIEIPTSDAWQGYKDFTCRCVAFDSWEWLAVPTQEVYSD